MASPRFLINLYNMGTNRGPGSLVAQIPDALDVGGSQYVNAIGEFFCTIPYNHPAIPQVIPLQRHYEVKRLNDATGSYDPIFVGLVDNFKQDSNEVTVTGRDYLSLLDTSITASTTSYNNTKISTIIQQHWTAAMIQNNQANSRLGFVATGSIATTSTTATVISAFESRLHFMNGLMDILNSSNSTRPSIQITRASPFTFSFNPNQGSDKDNIRLEYGGIVDDFQYDPGYENLATDYFGIGQKRSGATILYSQQTYGDASAYGTIQFPKLYIDVVDQTALDNDVLHDARVASRIGKGVALQVKPNGLPLWYGFDLLDAFTVIINRGPTNLNGKYTLWGVEWVADKGGEALYLDLLPKDV